MKNTKNISNTKNMQVIMIVCFATICLSSLVQAQEKEETKIVPRLLWQKTFEGGIDFTMSNDGELILVNETKHFGDMIVMKRYIIDDSGKVVEEKEGFGIITGDGRNILQPVDGTVEGSDGKVKAKIPIGPFDIERLILSPTGKYVAIAPSYDADYPFLRVYQTETGRLLWKFQEAEQSESDSVPFYILASFVTDESLAVFSLEDGKISLHNARNGKQYWERPIPGISEANPREFGSYNELVAAKSGSIVLFYRITLPPTKENTKRRFTGRIFSLNSNGEIRWSLAGWRVRVIAPSPTEDLLLIEKRDPGLNEICLLNNKNGVVIWKKTLFPAPNEPYAFAPDGKYLIAAGSIDNEEKGSPKQSILYLISTESGKVLWKYSLNSSCGTAVKIAVSEQGDRIIIADQSRTIYCLDVTALDCKEE